MTLSAPASARICVIHNPAAGNAAAMEEVARVLAARPGCAVRRAESPGDARALAAEARGAGFDVVIAAGGDGTVSQVIDGVLEAPSQVTLGILPLGTGNDLARSLGLPLEPVDALHALLEGKERQVDLVKAEADDGAVTYVANCAVGGFGGEVDRALEGVDKRRFGPLAYLLATLRALPELRPYRVTLRWNDALMEEAVALGVIVANARTVAGGWPVAPDADLEDGMLDVVVVREGSAVELAALAARVAAGDPFASDLVLHRRARAVRVTSDPPMWFNADGELMTREGVSFAVAPRAIRVLVGAGYGRER